MGVILLLVSTLLLRDEAALREAYAKEIQAEAAGDRVAAVKKLAGAKEEKTIELLAGALKDKALEVRKAAAATLEASTDGAGVANKPLGEIMVDKKDDLDLRFACAKALAKSRYKGEVFQVFYKAMSEIGKEEREFHKFGFQITRLLDSYIGKSFGADKDSCERWEEWWTDNGAALKKEDAKQHEDWKKEGK